MLFQSICHDMMTSVVVKQMQFEVLWSREYLCVSACHLSENIVTFQHTLLWTRIQYLIGVLWTCINYVARIMWSMLCWFFFMVLVLVDFTSILLEKLAVMNMSLKCIHQQLWYKQNKTDHNTDMKNLSFWLNFHHWLHCHFDNFQCSQWWKSHQNEDISLAMNKMHILRGILYHTDYTSIITHIISSYQQLIIFPLCVVQLLPRIWLLWYFAPIVSTCMIRAAR